MNSLKKRKLKKRGENRSLCSRSLSHDFFLSLSLSPSLLSLSLSCDGEASLSISPLSLLVSSHDGSYFHREASARRTPSPLSFGRCVSGGIRPLTPPRHDTTAPEEPTPARIQPPRQAKMKDAEFHYT